MILRYLILDKVPELRAEPGNPEKGLPEVELLLPIEVFWEAQDLITSIRYETVSGTSSTVYWHKLTKLIGHYVVKETDRLWFKKNLG